MEREIYKGIKTIGKEKKMEENEKNKENKANNKKTTIKLVITNLVIMLAICTIILITKGCANQKLKPPKKSPCACYDIKIDMEKISHV